VLHAVRKACRLRDQEHRLRFAGTWSVNNPWCMQQYIRMGVDGIAVDRGPVWYNFCWFNWGHGLRSLTHMVQVRGRQLGIRLATPADNVFADPAPIPGRGQPVPASMNRSAGLRPALDSRIAVCLLIRRRDGIQMGSRKKAQDVQKNRCFCAFCAFLWPFRFHCL
jgi:hypothetical protein